jgi:enhancing lycopene biosynthesis protein 2
MISRDDIEVIRRAIVLVILGTSQEFLVVHDLEICSLDGVVGVEGVRCPVLAVVVRTSSYLDSTSSLMWCRRLPSARSGWTRGG